MYKWRSIIRASVQLPVSIGWLIWIMATRNQTKSLNFSSINQQQINEWNRKRKLIDDYAIGVVCSFLIGLSILFQTIISAEPDHGVYMLYFFVVFLFIGIPYFFACVITWGLCLCFAVSMYIVLTNIVDNATTSSSSVNSDSLLFNVGHWGSTSFPLSIVYLTFTNLLLSIAAYSLERSERVEFMHGLDLEKQSAIIQRILNNLLPTHITDQLRNHNRVIADPPTECSILFSDLVSFTKWSSGISADSIIFRLHELYSLFDQLCSKHRVYKVETIGDAYFVSANCPLRRPNHAEALLILGEEMMVECKKINWDGYTPRMRIGIHSGYVIGGVVGLKMPRYHLFGETVVIAEELESAGKPDCLHISQDTYDNVEINRPLDDNYMEKNYHIIRRRKKIQVLKGERQLQTYLIVLKELIGTETVQEIEDEQQGKSQVGETSVDENDDQLAQDEDNFDNQIEKEIIDSDMENENENDNENEHDKGESENFWK